MAGHAESARKRSLQQILKETYGYESFRLDQERIINSILDGHDTLAIMPTGGGKSLCYQLPALYLDGLTLVVSPLISLMRDQVVGLGQYGVRAVALNSTIDFAERERIKEQIERGEVRLLYIAPEGILSPHVLTWLRTLKVALMAIDEAHCVSQWGHEFRSDYTRLGELKDVFPNVPTIALTATADERTRKDICRQLKLQKPNIFISSFDRPNIKYMILERENELKQLHEFIQTHHRDETGIVYCLSRNKVERVTQELKKMGYNAVPYHAGLSAREREMSQRRFDREEKIIVVATIAFGMGIDRPDVRFVAHLDLPKSIEGYYQETGRAGRDGRPATAWMVYGLSDVVKLSQMLETTEANESYKKVARHKLNQMLSLCEATTCRRHILLRYFGQTSEPTCNNCDACLSPPEQWDGTIQAQKLLSTVYRTGQMFGAGHVIDVLRGSLSEKVKIRGHDQLSVYGIGMELSKSAWNSVIRQLLFMNYLYIKDWDYKTLGLTEKSREVLRGQKNLLFRKLRLHGQEERKRDRKKGKNQIAFHGRPELFEKLRELRRSLAEQHNIPPYMVFPDKTLHDMCALLPRNDSEMLMVHGVGQAKLEKFGQPFLVQIANRDSIG